MPTARTPAELYAEIAAELASGQPGGITAQQLRTVLGDAVASATGLAVNVQWYGALPSASAATNSAAFNAAFAAAVAISAGNYATSVEIPPGIYAHNGITIQPVSGRCSINLKGLPGAAGVTLNYTGAGGTGLTVLDNVYFTIENIELSNGGSGTTTGMVLRGIAAGLASSGNAFFKNIVITGFTTGLHIGTATDQAADVLKFINLQISNSTTAILIEGVNGITIGFENLGGSNNTTFFRYVGDADNNTNCLRIVGGGTSGSTTELRIEAPLNLSVSNWYTEGSVVNHRFLDCPTPTYAGDRFPIQVRVSNCVLNQSNIVASRLYIPGSYTFENVGHYAAYDIGSTTAGDRFNLRVIQGTGGAATPVTYAGGGSGSLVNVRREQVGGGPNNNQVAYKDEFYVFRSGGTKKTIWEFLWDSATPPEAFESMVIKLLNIVGQTLTHIDSAGFPNHQYLKNAGGKAWRTMMNNEGGGFVIQYNASAFGAGTVFTPLTLSEDGVIIARTPVGTGAVGVRIPHGTVPASPVDGDMWTTTSGLFVRINGVTVGPLT